MINKITLYLFVLLLGITSASVYAQDTTQIDFEEISLPLDTFWNGSDSSGGFSSKGVLFPNTFDFTYNFWSKGWALSSMRNDTTAGYTNLYSAITGSGANSSTIYAIGQQNAQIKNIPKNWTSANGRLSIEITNTTYAALSMAKGDQFAKKFGGINGQDPDYFLLKIYAFRDGAMDTSAYVSFFLADYRDEDSTKDYIIWDWTKVDLSPLATSPIDSLQFVLESSDTSQYGYNTPLFFAIDNLSYEPITEVKDYTSGAVSIFPNPAKETLSVFSPYDAAQCRMYTTSGLLLKQFSLDKGVNRISVNNLKPGLYLIQIRDKNNFYQYTKSWIKQ